MNNENNNLENSTNNNIQPLTQTPKESNNTQMNNQMENANLQQENNQFEYNTSINQQMNNQIENENQQQENNQFEYNTSINQQLNNQIENNVTPTENSNQPIDNQLPPSTPPRKNNTLIIIVIIIGIIALTIGTILIISNSHNKKENKEENKEESKEEIKEDEKSESEWNGIYTNKNGMIYLYQQDAVVYFEIDFHNSSAEGTADINGNDAEGSIFSDYKFTLKDNSIEFSTTDEDLEDGILTKTNKFTTEDFFERYLGDTKYMNSEINGIYEKDDTTIKLFQIEKDKAEITIINDNSYSSRTINILNGNLSYEDEFLDTIEKINITIDNNKINVTASSSDIDDILNEINGTYTKTKKYTAIDFIRQEKFGFYL